MPTLQSVMEDLKSKGSEQFRKTYARHGIPVDRTFGVSNAHLKTIAKTIKGQQTLALELYETGNMDAMYLAGIIANGAHMTPKQLQSWADGAAGLPIIAEHTVAWVTVENPEARKLATKWIASNKEHIASAGWCTYSGLVATKPDDTLDLPEIEALLKTIVTQIDTAKNRVRYTMNNFVISVGRYINPLRTKAKSAAQKIGPVSVDMGDTACEVSLATASIAKIEAAGEASKKRKTIRC